MFDTGGDPQLFAASASGCGGRFGRCMVASGFEGSSGSSASSGSTEDGFEGFCGGKTGETDTCRQYVVMKY